MYSMCRVACVRRGSPWNENLEALQVDWKRETIFHNNLIPLLENFQILAFAAIGK